MRKLLDEINSRLETAQENTSDFCENTKTDSRKN
jgi:hypothetical protein